MPEDRGRGDYETGYSWSKNFGILPVLRRPELVEGNEARNPSRAENAKFPWFACCAAEAWSLYGSFAALRMTGHGDTLFCHSE
jgi:hypothetical protein